ncbi:unnamed protein product [Dovyalis caffra]|uniref:Uncharacterized protein n=1 Tax=Dovyalis caffra TaxID=77055 RepID=A0AAV1RTD8_9ROSI|nr:unnamed protein product [Dovyalis caffra]
MLKIESWRLKEIRFVERSEDFGVGLGFSGLRRRSEGAIRFFRENILSVGSLRSHDPRRSQDPQPRGGD